MKLEIDESRCKGCNLCTMVCPYRIYRPGNGPNR
ncbi:MAG: 4Fe-4S binding protein, partial [Methanospirillum sp.]|nr:4Fe-4S binding protein [Methanospirillum sp.]